MKNFVRNALLLSAVAGVSASAPSAADCCYPTQPCCNEWGVSDGKFTLGADYLYWQSKQDNLDIISTTVTDGTTTRTTDHHPNFKYESGYRVYANYQLPCDQWDIGASYTYVPTNAGAGNYTATTALSIGDGLFSAFDGKWNSTFQYADVEMARTLKFGESFRLRPHAGFRAAWGDQKVHFNGTFADPNVDFGNATNVATSLKQTFNAYGIEAGLWSEYVMFGNFSVVGHFGGSILYNEIKNKGSAVYSIVDVAGTNVVANDYASENVDTILPSLDYFLGVRWQDNFCDWDFSVHAGWEAHVWFDLGNLYDRGNFTTQGLTAGLDVSF